MIFLSITFTLYALSHRLCFYSQVSESCPFLGVTKILACEHRNNPRFLGGGKMIKTISVVASCLLVLMSSFCPPSVHAEESDFLNQSFVCQWIQNDEGELEEVCTDNSAGSINEPCGDNPGCMFNCDEG